MNSIITLHGHYRDQGKLLQLESWLITSRWSHQQQERNVLLTIARAIRDEKEPQFAIDGPTDAGWIGQLVKRASRIKACINIRPSSETAQSPWIATTETGAVVSFMGPHAAIPITELTHIVGLTPSRAQSVLRNKIAEYRLAMGQGLPPFTVSDKIRAYYFKRAAEMAIMGA